MTKTPLTSDYYDLVTEREFVAFPMSDESKSEAYSDWFHPDRNISYVYVDEHGEVQAFVAAILLSRAGWNYIHDTNEPEVDETLLIEENTYTDGDQEYGIHIFMIEKLDIDIINFTQTAYTDIFQAADKLAPNANLIGLSGYSVGVEACHLALLKHGRHDVKPSHYFMLINPDGELEAAHVDTQQQLADLLSKGYQVRNKCHLSSIRVDQPSIIWQWLPS